MITNIKITDDFTYKERVKTLPLNIEGKNINVLVAPNGFGKSTIFKSIRTTLFEQPLDGLKISFTKEFVEDPVEVFFMSPHEFNGKSILENANPFDSDQYNHSLIEGFKRVNLSSGQETRELLLDFEVLAKKERRIIFLDEPEISMYAIELYKFKEKLKNLKNIQVWIISHNPMFIFEKDFNVVSLEKGYADEVKSIYSQIDF